MIQFTLQLDTAIPLTSADQFSILIEGDRNSQRLNRTPLISKISFLPEILFLTKRISILFPFIGSSQTFLRFFSLGFGEKPIIFFTCLNVRERLLLVSNFLWRFLYNRVCQMSIVKIFPYFLVRFSQTKPSLSLLPSRYKIT